SLVQGLALRFVCSWRCSSLLNRGCQYPARESSPPGLFCRRSCWLFCGRRGSGLSGTRPASDVTSDATRGVTSPTAMNMGAAVKAVGRKTHQRTTSWVIATLRRLVTTILKFDPAAPRTTVITTFVDPNEELGESTATNIGILAVTGSGGLG